MNRFSTITSMMSLAAAAAAAATPEPLRDPARVRKCERAGLADDIRPRRTRIVDEQKGLAAALPLVVGDRIRSGALPDAPPATIQGLATLPYGLGHGRTPGSGR